MAFGLPGQTPPKRPSGSSPYSSNGGSGSPYSNSGSSASSGSRGQSPSSGGLSGGGFSDRPDSHSNSSDKNSGSSRGRAPSRADRTPAKRPSYGGGGLSTPDIPWKIIGYGALIVLAIVLIVVFRDPIRAFLSEVLSWLIIIGIVVLILRFFVFRRRR